MPDWQTSIVDLMKCSPSWGYTEMAARRLLPVKARGWINEYLVGAG